MSVRKESIWMVMRMKWTFYASPFDHSLSATLLSWFSWVTKSQEIIWGTSRASPISQCLERDLQPENSQSQLPYFNCVLSLKVTDENGLDTQPNWKEYVEHNANSSKQDWRICSIYLSCCSSLPDRLLSSNQVKVPCFSFHMAWIKCCWQSYTGCFQGSEDIRSITW